MVTHEFCGSCITEEFFRGETGFGGAAAWPGANMGDEPSVVRLMDAKAVLEFEKWCHTSLCLCCMSAPCGLFVRKNGALVAK